MNDVDMLWATMDNDERTLRMESLNRRALAALIAGMAFTPVVGLIFAMFLAGAFAGITFVVARRRLSVQLLAQARLVAAPRV